MKKIFALGSFLFLFACVADEAFFQSDFVADPALKNWRDAWWQNAGSKVRKEAYEVVTENGETYLRSKKMDGKYIFSGIQSPLKKDLVVDDKVKEIRMSVVLRKRKGHISYMPSFALTSNTAPDSSRGMPFRRGNDSGFQVTGNDYNYHFAGNYLSWQKNGDDVTFLAPKKPCNFLTALEKWITWTLVYDNQAKELRFFRNEGDKEPFLVQRNVNLNGTTLKAVWLIALCTEYKDVKVTVSYK